jgi:hypothetical protein
LVHLLEQASPGASCHVVECGSLHYTGAEPCACSRAGGNKSRHDSNTSNAGLTQRLSEFYISTPAAIFAPPEAVLGGYVNAYKVAPRTGHANAYPAARPTNPPLQSEVAQAHYRPSTYGPPVNTASGCAQVEQRSVHMANLSHQTREWDVKRLLRAPPRRRARGRRRAPRARLGAAVQGLGRRALCRRRRGRPRHPPARRLRVELPHDQGAPRQGGCRGPAAGHFQRDD